MDLSPKLLTEVRFREQWRGYNPEEVDEFLERVAAGLEETQQRLADALERASNAERRLLERSDEDEVRRTLVLAQRTAVTAMEEARAEADRLVSETEARCRQLVAEAEAESARLESEIALRRRTELGDLAEERAVLQVDIDAMRTFVDSERNRLADALRSQLEWFESGYRTSTPPAVADIPVPAEATEPRLRAAEIVESGPESETDPESELAAFADALDPDPEPQPVADPVDDLRLARAELSDALRRAGVEPAEAVDEPMAAGGHERPALFDDGADDTGSYDVLADEPEPAWAAEHEPEPAAADLRWKDDEDEDPFLAELRRAVVDTEPLGPRDHQAPVVVHTLDHEEPSGGFFRRGRRR